MLHVFEREVYNIGRDAVPISKPKGSKIDKFLNIDD